MDIGMGIAIVGLLQAVAVAAISGLFARENKARRKQIDDAEAKASLRAEESRLSMRLLSADINLTMATARAVRDGVTNGKMEHALSAAEQAQADYYNFINSVAAKQFTA